MAVITLIIVMNLPNVQNPVIHQEKMESIRECVATVREMVYRAPNELKDGGTFSAGCQVIVAKSENP